MPTYSSSAYVMMKPSAVSFSRTTSWDTMAGSIELMACGNSTSRTTWFFRSPIAYDASRWPFGTAAIPARKISARTEPL